MSESRPCRCSRERSDTFGSTAGWMPGSRTDRAGARIHGASGPDRSSRPSLSGRRLIPPASRPGASSTPTPAGRHAHIGTVGASTSTSQATNCAKVPVWRGGTQSIGQPEPCLVGPACRAVVRRHGYELREIHEGHGVVRYRRAPTREIDSAYATLTAQEIHGSGKRKPRYPIGIMGFLWLRGPATPETDIRLKWQSDLS